MKIFLLFLLLLNTPLLLAQESESNDTIDNETSDSAERVAEQLEAEGDNSDDDFVPTQEISEDLSVAFPVDI